MARTNRVPGESTSARTGLLPEHDDQHKNGSAKRRRISLIYEEIRKRICLLEYPPGMILREGELAEEFDVSRTPIREAFQRLGYEGLVETRNGVGTFVTGVDFRSFSEGYDLRIELAAMIGRLSPRACNREHVDKVRELLARANELGASSAPEVFWMINHELHELINGLIGNRELAILHSLYYYKFSRFWYHLARDDLGREVKMLQSELGELLEAFGSGDIVAVANVHRNHISFGKIRMGRYISGFVGG